MRRKEPSARYYRHRVRGGTKEIPLWLFGDVNRQERIFTRANVLKTSFRHQHIVPLFIRFLKEERVFLSFLQYQTRQQGREYTMNNLKSTQNFWLIFVNVIRFCHNYGLDDARDAWIQIQNKWQDILNTINYTPKWN